MIQYQLKLRSNAKLEKHLDDWLWMLTGVHNFAVRKVEQDAKDGIYYTPNGFQNILAEHGKKMGIPSHTLQGVLSSVYTAWQRRFKKIGGKPKLKGARNKLNSIKGMAKKMGKSVASSSHAQLRNMISYKSIQIGTKYVEVLSRNSTITCSSCGALTGPRGLVGLKVRNWECGCGATHDRDQNSAINTLISGLEQSSTRELRDAA